MTEEDHTTVAPEKMENQSPAVQPVSQTRQPKKRFVGRRTADAQAQKDAPASQEGDSTAVQKGQYFFC